MMEYKKNGLSGFSLAEALIMLVVVSVIMALSAPLIAKKSSADQKRLITSNGSEVLVAQGSSQTLKVGNNGHSSEKLKVFGSAVINASDVEPDEGEIRKVVFKVDTNSEDDFKVYSDGTTSIRSCVPDWSAPTNAPVDGYVVANVCISVRNSNIFCPSIMAIHDGDNNVSYSYVGNVVVPVAAGDAYDRIEGDEIGPPSGDESIVKYPCLK